MAAVKRGLGKGLSALITDDLEQEITDKSKGIVKINVNEVGPNKEQPRKKFDEDQLQELSDSIKQYGVIQPLIVIKKNKFYEIVAGERRWRAAKLAGLKEVPVIIKGYTPREKLEVSLIENIQRENLNPIEEAFAYQKLINDFKLKQDDVAEKVAKSRSAIANSMRLLNLDERVQRMIVDEMISSGHARTLLAIKDSEIQYNIANKVFDEKLSVRDTEKLIKSITKPKTPKKGSRNDEALTAIYKDIEERFKEILGTKVTINHKSKKKGKIEIEYYSDDELERLIELINSIKEG
ncbi:ParB/RepB/Spo0J family partition protein [Vallitalea sp.]|jgi:ParB family chromosome partitioning protein|uniref:ParB/RepB/Spo0J family partition protein n=1 Tax=Vallitalea sp. TaxID=1882829 RepID=UPI0025E64235|nr:ParB/RepB/Spo0J family partition protein [Vallitalea sp.]MCT4687676.1 ParB/RepB/Spo0J family partition protein [Vallitalea sp.]